MCGKFSSALTKPLQDTGINTGEAKSSRDPKFLLYMGAFFMKENVSVKVYYMQLKVFESRWKFVLPASSADFLCEDPRAPRPPVKPISQTFYASRHRRSGGKNQSPKSLPVVVGYFPVPKAEPRPLLTLQH